MIQQSVSWWGFHREGIQAKDLMAAIQRVGYSGVELIREELWPLVREHGLTISAAGGHRSLTDGLNKHSNHDRIEDEIKANLAKAVEWGIPNLIVFTGNREGLDDEAGAENTAEGLRRVAAAAEEAGVTLILELLNSRVNHPDYQADRTLFGVKVCQMVNSPRVKLLYDIYHMQIMEGDVIATIRAYSEFIGHYHTAGVPGRHDLDEQQELYYPAIIRAINATGFDGYCGHEFIPKGDPIAALEAAFRTCAL